MIECCCLRRLRLLLPEPLLPPAFHGLPPPVLPLTRRAARPAAPPPQIPKTGKGAKASKPVNKDRFIRRAAGAGRPARADGFRCRLAGRGARGDSAGVAAAAVLAALLPMAHSGLSLLPLPPPPCSKMFLRGDSVILVLRNPK